MSCRRGAAGRLLADAAIGNYIQLLEPL